MYKGEPKNSIFSCFSSIWNTASPMIDYIFGASSFFLSSLISSRNWYNAHTKTNVFFLFIFFIIDLAWSSGNALIKQVMLLVDFSWIPVSASTKHMLLFCGRGNWHHTNWYELSFHMDSRTACLSEQKVWFKIPTRLLTTTVIWSKTGCTIAEACDNQIENTGPRKSVSDNYNSSSPKFFFVL